MISGDDCNGKIVLVTQYDPVSGQISYLNKRVSDVIQYIRRNGYEWPFWGNVVQPIDEEGSLNDVQEILVRVKPGMEHKFREEYESSPDMVQHRNVSLYELVSLKDLGYLENHEKDMEVRLYIVVIVFMLIVMFLGLFGTFWFRVESRTGEIAIRRVCGGTRMDIFRRVIGEGLILLGFAAVLAAIVGWFVIFRLHLDDRFLRSEIIWLEVVSLAVVAIGIIVSMVGPALNAMRIQPAIAIKDE